MSSTKPIALIFGPVLAVLAVLSWAAWYVFSVASNSRHDGNALALILPLVWILAGVGVVVIVQTIASALRGSLTETLGLRNWKRLSYLVALALLLITLPWLGFLGAGIPFFIGLAWWLGFRKPLALAGATMAVALLFAGAFNAGLDIDLPLWPVF